MLIDAHQHAFCRRDPAGLVADLDAQGIDHAWLLTFDLPPEDDRRRWHGHFDPVRLRPDGTHPGVGLQDQLRAREQYPGRFTVGYGPHPSRGDAAALFEAAVHMHGVRICGECKFRLLLDDPRCIELFRKAGQLSCPVLVHIDIPYLPDEHGRTNYQTEWFGGTIRNLERAMQACPETVFIGHAPGFWREISGGADVEPGTRPTGAVQPGGRLPRMLGQYPNLYGDLSATSALRALDRDPPFARQFLIDFADHLLFGRDDFGHGLQSFLQTLDLPETVQAKIHHENAQKLVPLDAG